MPELPHLVVPSWRELSSGLIVPSSVADLIAAADADGAARIPAELRGPPRPVAVVDGMPMSADQLAGALNEAELGLEVSTIDRLIELGAVRELSGRPNFRLYGL